MTWPEAAVLIILLLVAGWVYGGPIIIKKRDK